MSERRHLYRVRVAWAGRTTGYCDYSRDHLIAVEGVPPLAGSSDPAFRGSPDRWSPEQLLVASVAACHKLWFLHLASEAGLVVTSYNDEAEGTMIEDETGGKFERITLRPNVTLASGDGEALGRLHEEAHRHCFIANSVAFPVEIHPVPLQIMDATTQLA